LLDNASLAAAHMASVALGLCFASKMLFIAT